MLKQRLAGLFFIIVGIICPVIDDGNATASVMLIPFGLVLLFSKRNWMY